MKLTLISLITTLIFQIAQVGRTDANIKDWVEIQKVKGTTDLYTGIYYIMTMKAFPQGYITWLSTKNTGVYDIEVELNEKDLPNYAPGQPNYFDVQWTFGPTEVNGQYTLSCKRKPFGFLTYSSGKIGHGLHAVIIDTPTNRPKMLSGGAWRKDVLWKVKSTNQKKYYKLENMGMAKSVLSWSTGKPTPTNYYIQLATLDYGDDSKFHFEPAGIKLIGKISNFKFNQNPEDVLKRKRNQSKSLVARQRFPNNSSATLKSSVEETLEVKDSVSYTFSQSFSMLVSTTIEANFAVAKASATMTIQGGIDKSKSVTKETVRKTTVKTDIEIPKFSDIEASIYNVISQDISIDFVAEMLVTGTAERINAAKPSATEQGFISGDVIESYIISKGEKDMKIIKKNSDGLLCRVSGKLGGNVVIDTIVTTKQIKDMNM